MEREHKMIREQIDTVDALMAYYVAGALPVPARVLVQSHLEMQSTNRAFVSDLECLAGNALDASTPINISNRDSRLEAIFGSKLPFEIEEPKTLLKTGGLFPKTLRDFVGFEVDDIPWRTKLPGFKEYVFGHVDGCEVSFFWIRPGRAVPAHTHKGVEMFLVLDGAFSDRRGRYGPGDISVADESVDHRPIAEKDRPCIGFSVVDQPLKLTGSLTQLIGDLIG